MDWTTIIMVALFFGGSALALVGQRLGWPILVAFANWIKSLADKDGDGKPDAPPAATVTKVPAAKPDANATQLEVAPPTYAAFVAAGAAKPRKVALTGVLSILVLFFPLLKELIAKALDALAARLGREPTQEEAVAAAWQVHDEWVAGEKRQHPVAVVEPVSND